MPTKHRVSTQHAARVADFVVASDDKVTSLPTQKGCFLAGIEKVREDYEPQTPIVKDLLALITKHNYFEAFEAAIRDVSSVRPRISELCEIDTFARFLFYVDRLARWVPEIRVWEAHGETLHERTLYNRCVQFYFYFNQKSLTSLQSPISPRVCTLTPLSRWMRDFAVSWGDWLDTPESAQCLETFMYAPEYAWQDYAHKPADYNSFNKFFGRTFKDIERQRPVAQPANDRIVVFPAESTFVMSAPISSDVGEPVPRPPSVVVKHVEWPIEDLLQGSAFASHFSDGDFTHSFLNTFDYHRIHTCCSGIVREAKFIPGQVYLDVSLVEGRDTDGGLASAIIPHRHIDADDTTGYQFVQCRGMLVLDNEHLGKVAILPIGMCQVSSVVFVGQDGEEYRLTEEEAKGTTYEERVELVNKKIEKGMVGTHLDKGAMFSIFEFGGSDVVVVFERKANINFTALPEPSVMAHSRVRSQMAVANY